MTRLIPARFAAKTFSFTPPTGKTLPRKVISPVIATSEGTGLFRRSDSRDVSSVTPADGPSFGMAPAGTCTWKSNLSKVCSSIPKRRALERM